VKIPRLVIHPPTLNAPEDYVCRPLVGGWQSRDADMPWVAVAEAHEDGSFRLARRAGRDRAGVQALVAAARQNTLASPASWAVVEQRGLLWWKKPSMLRAIGDLSVSPSRMATEGGGVDDLSSDVLLDGSTLANAAEQLGTTALIAIVPKRGWLLVARGTPGDIQAAQPLHQAADGIAGRAGAHALSRAVFFLKDGDLVGISVSRGNDGYISLMRADEEHWYA
jgi:hypothetical protein